MAFITHLCVCGHFAIMHSRHKPLSCPNRACDCVNVKRDPDNVELMPTMDVYGEWIDAIAPPGSSNLRMFGGGYRTQPQFDDGGKTCDCPACTALYDELMAARAGARS